jgi:hypothetical protein
VRVLVAGPDWNSPKAGASVEVRRTMSVIPGRPSRGVTDERGYVLLHPPESEPVTMEIASDGQTVILGLGILRDRRLPLELLLPDQENPSMRVRIERAD